MTWNDHSELKGKHARLSPSQSSWADYDVNAPDFSELMFQRYKSDYATDIGTLLHKYAEMRVRYRMKMHKSSKDDVLLYLLSFEIPLSVIDMDYIFDNMMHYVNDAIGFRMDPEIILKYSKECFGTADAIYAEKNNLRIHDYKSGKTPAHMRQLEIYAALYCLEYGKKPADLDIVLRIYQFGDIIESKPEAGLIEYRMNTIVVEDKEFRAFEAEDRLR